MKEKYYKGYREKQKRGDKSCRPKQKKNRWKKGETNEKEK